MQAKEQLGFGAEEALLGVGLNLQSVNMKMERLNDEMQSNDAIDASKHFSMQIYENHLQEIALTVS